MCAVTNLELAGVGQGMGPEYLKRVEKAFQEIGIERQSAAIPLPEAFPKEAQETAKRDFGHGEIFVGVPGEISIILNEKSY